MLKMKLFQLLNFGFIVALIGPIQGDLTWISPLGTGQLHQNAPHGFQWVKHCGSGKKIATQQSRCKKIKASQRPPLSKIKKESAHSSESAWKPRCLRMLPASKEQTYARFGKSSDNALVERRTVLSNWDMSTLRDVRSGPESTKLDLTGFPSDALMATYTDAQDFTSGISGGMDLFGVLGMFVSSGGNAMATNYFGESQLNHHF
jgi:hypothetical protein